MLFIGFWSRICPPSNLPWLKSLCVVLLILGVVLSVCHVSLAQPITGERDYVPNGSFEQITIDHQRNPTWPAWGTRYLFASRWWRQFHRYMLENSTAPPFIIPYDQDRVPYIPAGTFYDPISCSSADLLTTEQEPCIPGVGGGSYVGIPENWFGYEPTRTLADAANTRYAGLYYRLNGVDAGSSIVPLDRVTDPANQLWREYLEVELLAPLQKDGKYTLSYYASLSEVSTHAIGLEARVSPNPYLTIPQNSYLDACYDIDDNDGPNARVGIPYTIGDPGLKLASAGRIDRKNGWTLVQHDFVANGGERYLTIGNFEARPSVDVNQPLPPVCQNYFSNPNATEFAYYYIDDVRLTEAIECVCNGSFQVKLIPALSQDPAKCCFRVRLINGGGDVIDARSLACTIYGMDIHAFEGSLIGDRAFRWESRDASTSNPTKQPVVGDYQWYDLGTICLPALDQKESRELVVIAKGKDGKAFCEERISYRGCTDNCNCDDFAKSVRVEPNTETSDKCCFNVHVDASKLKSGCTIGSIDIYSSLTFLDKDRITETYKPEMPVDPKHSGFLYSFCIEKTNVSALTDSTTIVFRGLDGSILCWKNVKLRCDCDCSTRSPKLELLFEDALGKCCFDVSVAATTSCPFNLTGIRILTDENITLSTVSSDWLLVKDNSSVTLVPRAGSANGNNKHVIGRLCIPTCFAFNPKSLVASANITVGGVACSVSVDVNAELAQTCRGNVTCDDVIVTLEKPPIGRGVSLPDDCCRFVRIQLRNCTSRNRTVAAEVIGPGGIPVKSMNLGSGIFESAPLCRTYRIGETFTINLRDPNGTVICTKKVTVPDCSRMETNE